MITTDKRDKSLTGLQDKDIAFRHEFHEFPRSGGAEDKTLKKQIHIHRKVTKYAKVSYNLDKKIEDTLLQTGG